jgi:predicted NACHT family NTPase
MLNQYSNRTGEGRHLLGKWSPFGFRVSWSNRYGEVALSSWRCFLIRKLSNNHGDEVVGPGVLGDRTWSSLHRIGAIYLETGQALLVLGDPDAGKTTLLLALARELIGRANIDPAEPIPVILNLATWSENCPPLADWIVEELTVNYQIPRAVGRDWLEEDQLVLLLDGFDEVPARLRISFVTALI